MRRERELLTAVVLGFCALLLFWNMAFGVHPSGVDHDWVAGNKSGSTHCARDAALLRAHGMLYINSVSWANGCRWANGKRPGS